MILVRGVQDHVRHVRPTWLERSDRAAEEARLTGVAPRAVLRLLGHADERRHARIDVPLKLHRDAADARPPAHRGERLLWPAGRALDRIVPAPCADDAADERELV